MFWKKAFTTRELRQVSRLAQDPHFLGRVQYLWYSKLRGRFLRAVGEFDRDAWRQVLANICEN